MADSLTLHITALTVYPIKGCAGVDMDQVILDHRGPVGDRRWMVVTPEGTFLTQREHPRLALVRPELTEDTLILHAPDLPDLQLPVDNQHAEPLDVTVWESGCVAADQGAAAAHWFSRLLDTPCRFVWMPEAASRPVDGGHDGEITFADGYPILLCHQPSLDDLNQRLESPISMNRFRPNVVVDGGAAWEEDHWTKISADNLDLEMAKPCKRCRVVTVDQATAEAGKEPLRTLATFRKYEDGICFGQNVIHQGPGTLRVGQEVRAYR